MSFWSQTRPQWLIYPVILSICVSYAAGMAGDSLRTGMVTDTVWCTGNPNQSYALYLPSNFSTEQKWPVIMIFEPGARGRMAADTFSLAGEQFGFIIMCSNNSSNRSFSGSVEAAVAMYDDALHRYPVDTAAVYAAGFSGGARFASNLAIDDHRIKGVIACGAGMYHNRNTHSDLKPEFLYYGIIGRRDTNLPDMIGTGERLERAGFDYHLQYTDIHHVWPSSEEIASAVAWLCFKTDRDGGKAKDHYLNFQTVEIEAMENRGQILDAADRLASLQVHFPDPGRSARLELLRENKLYNRQTRQRKRAYAQEGNLSNFYLDAIVSLEFTTPLRPDTVHTRQWWTKEINQLKRWERSGNTESSRLASRLLYLLEVHFDEAIEVYLTGRHWDKALFLADLWMEISPSQLWSLWNVCSVYARTGKQEEAIDLMEEMIGSGKAKPEWFRNVADFKSLHGNPRFVKLTDAH